MKIELIVFSLILYLTALCTSGCQRNSGNFTLLGQISGLDTGVITLRYMTDLTVFDTTRIIDGEFIFRGSISEPTRAELSCGDRFNRALFYIEPGRMKISVTRDRFKEYKITGSLIQKQYDELKEKESRYNDSISNLKGQYDSITNIIHNADDSLESILISKRDYLNGLWSTYLKKIDSVQIKFISENRQSYISVFSLFALDANEAISTDSTQFLFNKLDTFLKQSLYGKLISDNLRKKENTIIGAQAPDFRATGFDHQIVTLSQFKNKSIVLLDFWASWCKPCRSNIPHLKEIYSKYHPKGFEIIAVSLDTDREAWIKAINQDGTGMWYHIPVAERYPEGIIEEVDVYHNYFIQTIPVQILVDKNGKIIGRFRNASQENNIKLDHLISGYLRQNE